MAFEFGVFHEFQRRPGQSEAEAFTTAFEQVDAAEGWGLDAIWLAEIHMAPERSVCAAPLTIASAIAARTKNIKVGLGVQVLPLCQPLRLAEEAATVDHISRGRLVFGVGRSGFPRAYEACGISYGESTERFAEVLEVVKRAWTQETFSFAGKHYNYASVCIVPKPYRMADLMHQCAGLAMIVRPDLLLAADHPDRREAEPVIVLPHEPDVVGFMGARNQADRRQVSPLQDGRVDPIRPRNIRINDIRNHPAGPPVAVVSSIGRPARRSLIPRG